MGVNDWLGGGQGRDGLGGDISLRLGGIELFDGRLLELRRGL